MCYEPLGYFEQAVIRSIQRWTCEPDSGEYRFQGEVLFRLDGRGDLFQGAGFCIT